MPALEGDLELEVRRENALKHTHLQFARDALDLSGQLLDHLTRRCNDTENTAKSLGRPE